MDPSFSSFLLPIMFSYSCIFRYLDHEHKSMYLSIPGKSRTEVNPCRLACTQPPSAGCTSLTAGCCYTDALPQVISH